MKRKLQYGTTFFIILVLYGNYLAFPYGKKSLHVFSPEKEEVVIATVVCGSQRVSETLVMLKSAIYFSKIKLKFIIFTDDIANKTLQDGLALMRKTQKQTSSHAFEIHPISFPKNDPQITETEWKNIFRPCSCQRLFLPSLLPDVDSVLYMDSDSIFLTTPETFWDQFNQMNSSQVIGIAQEDEIPGGYYHKNYGIPYYGIYGVNAGILLMNLTRLRHFNLEKLSSEYYLKYKNRIRVGDQDILNTIFHFRPEKLYLLPCNFNYRTDHWEGNACKEAEAKGVYILHGNRMVFHKWIKKSNPAFHTIYETIKNFDADLNPKQLYNTLKETIDKAPNNPWWPRKCKYSTHILLKALKE